MRDSGESRDLGERTIPGKSRNHPVIAALRARPEREDSDRADRRGDRQDRRRGGDLGQRAVVVNLEGVDGVGGRRRGGLVDLGDHVQEELFGGVERELIAAGIAPRHDVRG